MDATTAQQEFSTAIQHYKAGEQKAAEDICRRILRHDPSHAEAWHMVGDVALEAGRHDEAVEFLEQSVRLDSESADAFAQLGAARQLAGDVAAAITAYRRCLSVRPNHFAAQMNLGNALRASGDFLGAVAAFEAARDIQPDSAAVWSNLGSAYAAIGEEDAAIDCHYRAVEIEPQAAGIQYNFANTCRNVGMLSEAERAYRETARLQPGMAAAYNNLGSVLLDQGRVPEACTYYLQAVKLDHSRISYASNLLFAMHYEPALSTDGVFDAHCRWGAQMARTTTALTDHPRDRALDRPLRVGYLSPDFRQHSVARFIEPILINHNPTEVETFCYASVAQPDAATARLQTYRVHWRDIFAQSDEEAAEQIQEDKIDILVDLAGHTAGNRLGVFARKPAPVQVTYLGYGSTTGLPTIDYHLVDAWTDPWFQRSFTVEKVFRLPCGFVCFQPPATEIAVGPPPIQRNGSITFGSFNHLAKTNESVVRIWSELLRSIPNSRLVLKSQPLGDSGVRERYRDLFLKQGIATDRLDLLPHTDTYEEHLASYGEIDVGLDPFPYAGTTTTCEALWMGVPVVTLSGDTHIGRVGVSLLSRLGLNELVARNPEEYIRKAVELAGDLPRLTGLRSGLRQAMANSSLCDAAGLTEDLEQSYRTMWEQCQRV